MGIYSEEGGKGENKNPEIERAGKEEKEMGEGCSLLSSQSGREMVLGR